MGITEKALEREIRREGERESGSVRGKIGGGSGRCGGEEEIRRRWSYRGGGGTGNGMVAWRS